MLIKCILQIWTILLSIDNIYIYIYIYIYKDFAKQRYNTPYACNVI